ncbi:MraY family glycosyltransferase [Demequina gelatinilytica]|uniref:MraY family glycosyltransferase n=1 Tax=Demequina gelatinilytica TaxID=1638980 RepID=UPI0007809BAD|nr:MraY family glycosyltransferase [Demequina gelatinilytica]
MKVYLTLMAIAALVAYVATPAARHLAFRVGAITAVRARDVHTTPIPRLGGIAIFLGLATAGVVASAIPFLMPVFDAGREAWAVLGGAAIVCALGMVDDIFDLDWMAKLAGQFLAGVVVASGGVQLVTVPIAGVTIGSSYVSLIATVFVVVIAMNAVNFVDGLDGLAAGMIAIGGTAFFAYTYLLARSASPGDYSSLATIVVALLVGACLGFLPHNVHPARIFMGDSGSMVLGLMLAAAAIIVTGQIDPAVISERERVPAFIPILLPIMVLAVPLVDMTAAVVRRTLRGDSPFSPDKHHLHHLLLRRGHSHRWAVTVLYIWTAVLSYGTVSIVFLPPAGAIAFTAVGVIGAAVVTASPRLARFFSRQWRRLGHAIFALQRVTPEGRKRHDARLAARAAAAQAAASSAIASSTLTEEKP